MDDDTWVNVVKVVSPGIIKMKVSNVDFLPDLFSVYLTLRLCIYKLSADSL